MSKPANHKNPELAALPTVAKEQIVARTQLLVSGKVSYARIASLIEGEELAARTKNSKSRFPTTDPHTTISIYDAFVMPFQADADPAKAAEQQKNAAFLFQKFYASTKNDTANFNVDLRRRLPSVFQIQPDRTSVVKLETIPGDPAADVEVVLQLSVFPGGVNREGQATNAGIGLDAVYIMEPGEYPKRASGVSSEALSALGLTFAGVVGSPAPQSDAQAGSGYDGHGLPASGQAETVTDPFSAAPAPQAQAPQGWPAQAPAAPQQPQQQTAPQQQGGWGAPAQQQPGGWGAPQQPQQAAPALSEPAANGWGQNVQSVNPAQQAPVAASGSAFGGGQDQSAPVGDPWAHLTGQQNQG